MITVYQDKNFRHLIKVVGDELYTNNNDLDRSKLRDALFSNNGIASFEGQVDFIACYLIGGNGPDDFASPNFAPDHPYRPRPLRGIIKLVTDLLPILAPNGATTLRERVSGIIVHEFSHYWVVDGNARVRDESVEHETPKSGEIWRTLNRGDPMPAYPIVGRMDYEWSIFLDGQDSSHDTVNHGSYLNTPGYGQYRNLGALAQTETMKPEGFPFTMEVNGVVKNVGCDFQFSALEQAIMGLDPPQSLGASFRLIEPKWAFPLTFDAGLFVEASVMGGTPQKWCLGFREGPHKVAAFRLDVTNVNGEVSLLTPTNIFAPGWADGIFDPYLPVGLRVWVTTDYVQNLKRTRALLQARVFPPNKDPLSAVKVRDIFPVTKKTSSIMPVPKSVYTDWITLAELGPFVKIERLGVIVRAKGTYVLLSKQLWLKKGRLPPQPVLMKLERPKIGPELLADGRLMVPYRYSDAELDFDYWEDASHNDAPKLWLPVPNNSEYIFGGVLRIDSCCLRNSSGLSGAYKTLVGPSRSIPLSNFIPSWPPNERQRRQEEPLDGKYKILFCVGARRGQDITTEHLKALDHLRRASEIVLTRLFRGIRRVDTSIEI